MAKPKKSSDGRNYFFDLGVTPLSTMREITAARRTLAQRYHPDRGGDEKIFKAIQAQYDWLTSRRSMHPIANAISRAIESFTDYRAVLSKYLKRFGSNPDLPLPQLPAPSKLTLLEREERKARERTQHRLRRQVSILKSSKEDLLRVAENCKQSIRSFLNVLDNPSVKDLTDDEHYNLRYFTQADWLRRYRKKADELVSFKKISREQYEDIVSIFDQMSALSQSYTRYLNQLREEHVRELMQDAENAEGLAAQEAIELEQSNRYGRRRSHLQSGAADTEKPYRPANSPRIYKPTKPDAEIRRIHRLIREKEADGTLADYSDKIGARLYNLALSESRRTSFRPRSRTKDWNGNKPGADPDPRSEWKKESRRITKKW